MVQAARIILLRRKLNTALVILSVWIMMAMMASIYEYLFLSNFPGVLQTMEMESYSFMNSLLAAILWALLGGVSFCAIELFYLQDKLEDKGFLHVVFTKLVVYSIMLVVINVLTSAFYNAVTFDASIFSAIVWTQVFSFLVSLAFWQPLLPFIGILTVTLFLIQINYKFGQGELWKYVKGKYFRPREEQRIFMFLDITASTSIAERLEPTQFFNFVNDFYHDITGDILVNLGEIVDYVGDEIIVSWTIQNGITEARCLKCFFDIQKRIHFLSERYEKKYGERPYFKAGMHLGKATIGEIGKIKKEITYFGDVMNTTSRIQGVSKEKEHELVISDALLKLLPENAFELTSLGEIQLRGKTAMTNIYGVRVN